VNEPDPIKTQALRANLAFREQRYREAAAGYEKCVALQPQSPVFHFNLGTAREKLGNVAGAIEAYLAAYRLNPQDARLALFAGAALEAAGRREDAATLFSLGDDVDLAIRRAKDNPRLDPEIRRRSAVADRVMREHFTRLHSVAVDESERRAGRDLTRVRHAIWTQTHDGPVKFLTPKQEPSIFYMPDLEAIPITSRERLPWASQVESKTAVVRDEYLAAVKSGAELSPYVDAKVASPVWRELRGQTNWSSLHLFKASQETPFAKFFPGTMKALEAADVVRIDGRPMELFFSKLKPGAHIPPHCGVANNRITIHLPLIVPGDCSIRVGSETHVWHEGELFAFDDSFEHEAWNSSSEDRVVLIFESHHPDLRPEERDAIEFTFEERGRWLRERRIPS
jgi:aspartate beta-hydroxylase